MTLRPDSTIGPSTVGDAVDRLVNDLTEPDRQAIAALAEAELIDLHLGLGPRLRNKFGLWGENQALRLDCQWLREGAVVATQSCLPLSNGGKVRCLGRTATRE